MPDSETEGTVPSGERRPGERENGRVEDPDGPLRRPVASGDTPDGEASRERLSPESWDDRELRSFVEASLLVSEEPLRARDLAGVLEDRDGNEIRRVMEQLKQEYDEQRRGFQLLTVSGGFKLTTRERHYPWLKKLRGKRTLKRISDAALETLVIVAYHQPITRSEVESVRGVNSQSVLNSLLEKNFIRISGRRDEIGRPIVYRTTEEFLDYFGLNTLKDLPDEEELGELLAESPGTQ